MRCERYYQFKEALANNGYTDDATSASARLKQELPDKGKEVGASAGETLARIGSQVDKTVQEGRYTSFAATVGAIRSFPLLSIPILIKFPNGRQAPH